MDDRINNICSLFYASHYIPLAVYEERAIVHIFSSAGSSLDLFSLFEAQSFSAEQTMYILTLPEQGTYGQIRIKNSPMRVLLGPVFPTPITEDTVMTVARRNLTDKKDMDALAEFLYSIPNSYQKIFCLTQRRFRKFSLPQVRCFRGGGQKRIQFVCLAVPYK